MKEVFELEVYRLAEDLSDMIWYAYDQWTPKAQHTMGYQILRPADSISANLAEGYGRCSPADRRKFYLYARGSFEETKTWLRKAIRRCVITPGDVPKYKALVNELGPKLNAYIRSTRVDSVKGQVSSFNNQAGGM
jgi:four helix bundle protein